MAAQVDQRKPILAGDLSDFDVRSLMSAFSLGRQVMTIEVLNPRGACDGRIVMQGGRVLSASAGGRSGAEAVQHLLKLSRPARFQVLREAPETFSRVQHIGTLAEVTAEPRSSQGPRPRGAEAARPRTRVMEGSLSDFDVATILQVVSTARQHTVMEVVDLKGARVGSIQLKAGMVVCAEAGAFEGVAAVRQLLESPLSFRFAVFREPEQDTELPLLAPLDEVLLRAALDGPPPAAQLSPPSPGPQRRSGVHRAVSAPPVPPLAARPEQRVKVPGHERSRPPALDAAVDPSLSALPSLHEVDASDLEDEVTTISERRSMQPAAPSAQPGDGTPVLDGSLRDFDLCSVLQVAGISRQLTAVRICDEQRQLVGEVRLQGGQILSVNAHMQQGLAALRLLLHSPRDFLFAVSRHTQPSGVGLTTLGSVLELLQQASAPALVTDDEPRFAAQAGSVLPGERSRRIWRAALGTGVVLAAAAGALLALRPAREEGSIGAQDARPLQGPAAAQASATAAAPGGAGPAARGALTPAPAARSEEGALGSVARVEPMPATQPLLAQMRGPAQIASMQGGLKLLGFHPGPVDGVIGPLTRAAVAAFQRAEGLPDDGELSASTEVRLYERIRSPQL